MEYKIVADSDGFFKFEDTVIISSETTKTDETVLETTEQPVDQVEEQPVVPTQFQASNAPKPVPLENPRSTRMSFFDGTSWDDGKRGVW